MIDQNKQKNYHQGFRDTSASVLALSIRVSETHRDTSASVLVFTIILSGTHREKAWSIYLTIKVCFVKFCLWPLIHFEKIKGGKLLKMSLSHSSLIFTSELKIIYSYRNVFFNQNDCFALNSFQIFRFGMKYKTLNHDMYFYQLILIFSQKAAQNIFSLTSNQ